MSSNYFGLAGNGSIIWYFNNQHNIKQNIKQGHIMHVKFGHRPLLGLPLSLVHFYEKYIKSRDDHSASHSFVILDILTPLKNIISVYLDFDGSVNIRENINTDDNRIYYLDRIIDNIPFVDIMNELYKGIPKYHHKFYNCKHFMERIGKVVFDYNQYMMQYLIILHKNKSIIF